ncbi:hypothetical protein B0J13DRAFT_126717 [Dactylonectria estremocensis]|uniref:Translation initiation factor 3 C-terminal domain-containing protein n=1 Tax=Dactylonectria estremocensis TaxID=1079267 RepID=A0A9P9FFW0_9HYPO|nr:hypothetical protein B0J13DRAFT_126717 [Dactylonectria estremocensis]
MSNFPCLNNSRRALYRVFVSPLERREASLQRQLLPLVHGHAQPRAAPGLRQFRSFGVSAPRLRTVRPPKPAPVEEPEDIIEDNEIKLYTTKQDVAKSRRDRYPQDHEITDPRIMVLDNGNFDGPLVTRHVLTRLAEGESLRMVNPYVPANPKENTEAQYAICKIVNKKEEYERQREARERRRVSKATSTKSKELELNWAIGDHDLQTKLRQMGSFLAKGMRVEVILGKKKNSRKVDDAEASEVLAKVKQGAEAAGAKEAKAMSGNLNKSLRLYFEGGSK